MASLVLTEHILRAFGCRAPSVEEALQKTDFPLEHLRNILSYYEMTNQMEPQASILSCMHVAIAGAQLRLRGWRGIQPYRGNIPKWQGVKLLPPCHCNPKMLEEELIHAIPLLDLLDLHVVSDVWFWFLQQIVSHIDL